MTLTLDEVRKTKFHMARRTGYEVSEVDLFVDRVEASFAQLTEENQMLKQQVEALKQAQTDQQREARSEPSIEELRRQGQAQQQPKQAPEPTQPVAAQTAPKAAAEVQKVVVSTSADASPAVVRLVQLATEQAEQLVNEAAADAKRTVEEANQKAHQITTDARTKAERLESETRTKAERLESESRIAAERMTNEARSHADDVERQAGLRRAELFASLEQERDQLQEAVSQLRSYEANYRESFVSHLKQQLLSVESVSVEPSSKPALADRESKDANSARPSQANPAGSAQPGQGSDTPRLDALLGENQRNN